VAHRPRACAWQMSASACAGRTAHAQSFGRGADRPQCAPRVDSYSPGAHAFIRILDHLTRVRHAFTGPRLPIECVQDAGVSRRVSATRSVTGQPSPSCSAGYPNAISVFAKEPADARSPSRPRSKPHLCRGAAGGRVAAQHATGHRSAFRELAAWVQCAVLTQSPGWSSTLLCARCRFADHQVGFEDDVPLLRRRS